MLRIKHKGQFKPTLKFFSDAKNVLPSRIRSILSRYGELGVTALQEATPKRSAKTAYSWAYRIDGTTIIFYNTNVVGPEEIPVAILIHYGHGTGTGGYVKGIDYINPALKPVFDQLADACAREVSNL